MTDSNETLERLTESTFEPLEKPLTLYAAHLRHIDEILERTSRSAVAAPAEIETTALKRMSPDDFSEKIIEKSGPMGIWDAVAGQLEKLAERIERR